jgi:hypothetical protein
MKEHMSHYTTIALEIRDRDALVAALTDLNIGKVEVFDTPQPIHGYDGQTRMAEVIICGVGYYGGDLGFHKTDDGRYEAVMDQDDDRQLGQNWRNRLMQRYGRHVAVAKLAKKGFRLIREEAKDGKLHLVLRRSA